MTKANPTKLIKGDSEVERTLLRRLLKNSEVEAEVDIEDREFVVMVEPRRMLSKYEKP